ncbi:MAG: hypothetical protein ABIC95_06390 [archaeon]
MPKEKIPQWVHELLKDEDQEAAREQDEQVSTKVDRQHLLDINSFSKEVLGKDGCASIEQAKAKSLAGLAQALQDPSPTEDDLRRAKDCLTAISNLNSRIKDTATRFRTKIQSLVKEGQEGTTLEKMEIKNDKHAEQVISAMKKMLPKDQQDAIGLETFIGKGVAGIQEVEKRLDKIIEVDGETMTALSQLLLGLQPLDGIVGSQETDLSIIKSLITDPAKAKRNSTAIHQRIAALSESVQKEKTQVLDVVREYYHKLQLAEEDERIRQVYWLEDQEQENTKRSKWFLHQFILPVLTFPSGNYATYPANPNEMKAIIRKGMISKETGRVNKKELVIGSHHDDLACIPYRINTVDRTKIDPKNAVCILFPVESVMKGRYFQIEDFTTGDLLIFDRAPDQSAFIKEVEQTRRHCGELIRNIRFTFKRWFEDAKKLNSRFEIKWDVTAKHHIEDDFTKRWIKEESGTFNVANKLSFDIVKFLTEQRFFTSLSNHLFFRDQKMFFDDPDNKSEKDYLEEMQRMTMEEFVSTIKEIRENYDALLKDAKRFEKNATLDIPIDRGIIVAPKTQLMFWEEFFDEHGSRPEAFYYDGTDLQAGIAQAMKTCKENKKDKKPPKIKMVRIYSYINSRPLQQL